MSSTELTVLDPPTLPALHNALQKAEPPFDVIHFDGHGVYDRQRGLGALCFEDPKDGDKPDERASLLIDADKLGALVKEHRVPLVFLEACQSAAEAQPAASVAARLLDEGRRRSSAAGAAELSGVSAGRRGEL